MISKHGSRLHPGVKAHQITAKEIETYLQELFIEEIYNFLRKM